MKIFRLRFFSLEKFFSGSIFESMQMIPEQFKTIAVAAVKHSVTENTLRLRSNGSLTASIGSARRGKCSESCRM